MGPWLIWLGGITHKDGEMEQRTREREKRKEEREWERKKYRGSETKRAKDKGHSKNDRDRWEDIKKRGNQEVGDRKTDGGPGERQGT